MFNQQDSTAFPVSVVLARRHPRRREAPGKDFDEATGACLGLCHCGEPCPFAGCRLSAAVFKNGQRGTQLQLDLGVHH